MTAVPVGYGQLLTKTPRVLYKFRGVEHFKRDLNCLLVDRHIHLADPKTLNDPYDSYPTFSLPRPDERQAAIDREVAAGLPEDEARIRRNCRRLLTSPAARERYEADIYENLQGRSGIASFCSRRTNAVVWANYASNSRGFAVGYRGRDAEGERAFPAMPVRYVRRRPTIPIFGAFDWHGAFLLKSSHWRFESEWRFIRPEADGGSGRVIVPPNAIVEVIVGAQMSKWHRRRVIACARRLPDGPRLFVAQFSKKRFVMEFREIT